MESHALSRRVIHFVGYLAVARGLPRWLQRIGCCYRCLERRRRENNGWRVSSMKSQFSGWTLGLICIVLAVSAVDQAEAETPTQVPYYYAGVGARGLKGDAVAAVMDSKIKLMNFGERTFSTRPALLLGGYDTEWRLPFTVEGKTNSYGFAWFGRGRPGLQHGRPRKNRRDGDRRHRRAIQECG